MELRARLLGPNARLAEHLTASVPPQFQSRSISRERPFSSPRALDLLSQPGGCHPTGPGFVFAMVLGNGPAGPLERTSPLTPFALSAGRGSLNSSRLTRRSSFRRLMSAAPLPRLTPARRV